MKLLKIIVYKLKGPLRVAKENGMVVESGVTIMGGVDFGSEPYLITLHKNCRISSNVTFINHDGGTWAFRNSMEEFSDVVKFGEIEVGEYSFIGAGSIILPGVHIGINCVVGAGSVVTKDVPNGMVVCGVPARIVCSIEQYAKKCKEKLTSNFDVEKYKENKKAYLIKHYRKENSDKESESIKKICSKGV